MTGEVNCQAIATAFLADKATRNDDRTLRYSEGAFWEWRTTRYCELSERDLRNRILTWMMADTGAFTQQTWRWVCDCVIAILMTDHEPFMDTWTSDGAVHSGNRYVSLANGIIDLSRVTAGEPITLIPHTPKCLNRASLPVAYRGDAVCPIWESCVHDWMMGDTELVAVLQEYMGYCLTSDVSFCVGMFLEGTGANGKTVFIDVLSDLLGKENCDHVPIENFNQQFALETTPGKLVNLSTETSTGKLPSNAIKQFVDGNTMKITRKYNTALSVPATAKLIISWNERPRVTDLTHGFWRRIMLVPWKRTYTPSEQDITLREKLRGELPGILCWAIEGHKRLYRARAFTHSKALYETTSSFQAESDPPLHFLKTCTRGESGAQVLKDDLYGALRNWCQTHGYTAPSAGEFALTVKRRYVDRVKSRRIRQSGTRVWVWDGLALTDDCADLYL